VSFPAIPVLLFWVSAAFALSGAFLAVRYLRLRLWRNVALFAAIMAANLVLAVLWWSAVGTECLLPHPSVVEYTPGMTLCPGQSAIFRIAPDTTREKGI